MADHSNSIDELRQQSEACRATLKETIHELTLTLSDTAVEIKTKLSPDHLKDEARAYAKGRRTAAVNALKESISANPLQALGIGAAVAYPLLGLMRSIPVPLALIGAGLLLSRKGALTADGQSTKRNGGFGSPEMPPLSVRVEQESRSAYDAPEPASTAAGTSSPAYGTITGAPDAISGMVHRNPFLIAALAMAAGGIIAASLPASRAEGVVLGKAGKTVKEKGRKAAAEVVKGAKKRVVEVAGDVAAAAEREGLTSEALDEAVTATADKIAAVVNRAVDKAVANETSEAGEETRNDGGENARH